jgi:hypothetical protein
MAATLSNLPEQSFVNRLVNAMTSNLNLRELEDLIRRHELVMDVEMAEEGALLDLIVEQRATTGTSNDTVYKLDSVREEIKLHEMILDALIRMYKNNWTSEQAQVL